ncbi:MAG: energy-coupling factor ABC transporter permease [Porticoccaceae bacterium]
MSEFSFHFIALIICVDLLILALALRVLPWRVLIREKAIQHLFFGFTLSLVFLWSLRAGLSPGLSVHFLGMTTLALVFGWDLAICAGVFATLGVTLIGREIWWDLPMNILCLVIIPVSISYVVLKMVEWRLPKHFFIYLLCCAFAGGGLAALGGGLAMAGILGLAEVYPWSKIYDEYLLYMPLIFFPEGLINGIIMTAMMVYYPDWVRTFDANRYLDGQ